MFRNTLYALVALALIALTGQSASASHYYRHNLTPVVKKVVVVRTPVVYATPVIVQKQVVIPHGYRGPVRYMPYAR